MVLGIVLGCWCSICDDALSSDGSLFADFAKVAATMRGKQAVAST